MANVKQSLKRLLGRCFDSINVLAFYLSGQSRINKELISALRDKYKGRRCFIVCNGPSLRISDLDKIHENGDVSIAMNMIGRCFDKTKWRPTVLMAIDGCVLHPKNKKVVDETECEYRFRLKKHFLRVGKKFGSTVFYDIIGDWELLDNPKFTTKVEEALYSIGTTAYQAIEVAVFLGCKEIYVIGCDMSYAVNIDRNGRIYYNDTNKQHFYGDKDESMSKIVPNPTWQLELAWKAALYFSKELNFKLYNATRGGCLEELPRVDFDTLFFSSVDK
ncbi:6-hydroxymethylpterin diphosphokinase MptE-like protein [uncultured Bacteroides sp.]|uniref:6-hydroxymethylpterin diphosphokinase MptE-like protein n=1 Tax=uncultured Bacteroides sp. TaxID=162156 RepID=UPI0025D82B6E|nr:6-hydroxymethylpterin diphosphokinase MptE-like protein [uncultured Bacteroides sp.]